ncbi:MAG: hypothetical protein JOZ69_13895 [Myxococcales bacterium]|nr:hypothetical protein [Myxococcales bacterium]
MSIDVILNRRARRLAGDAPLRRVLLDEARRGRARVHETETFEDLARAAAAIRSRGTGGVVLAGGDGTHMAGATALAHAYGGDLPPIALVRAGTVGTVARNLGARGPAAAWARRIVGTACAGRAHVEPRATLRVRDDAGGDRVGFIFGACLVARFFALYEGAPRQGLGTAAALVARLFAGSFVGAPLARRVLATTPCRLRVDGESLASTRWSLLLASVVRDLGLHMLATYRAGESLDHFHVVGSGLGASALGRQMGRVLAGRPLRGEPRLDALARSLEVAFDEPDPAYVLDGDVLRASAVSIEPGPSLPLLLP